jgi:prepilin-type N-terminal cleavage/methylation domain-containing protein
VSRARAGAEGESGLTLVELLVVLAIGTVLLGLGVAGSRTVIDAGRARQAAGFVVARMRTAKHHAVFRTAAEGLVFDRIGSRWTFRVCRDGNGNGIRRAELAGGVDACVEGPYAIETLFPDVRVAVDSSVPPPGGGKGSTDPVRFGVSDVASFTPAGTATAGTLYLRSALGVQYAVRVAGINGRTRVLRFDPALGRWREI